MIKGRESKTKRLKWLKIILHTESLESPLPSGVKKAQGKTDSRIKEKTHQVKKVPD